MEFTSRRWPVAAPDIKAVAVFRLRLFLSPAKSRAILITDDAAFAMQSRAEFPADRLFIAVITDDSSESAMESIIARGADWVSTRPLNLAEFFGIAEP
jgi:hypothetical protein